MNNLIIGCRYLLLVATSLLFHSYAQEKPLSLEECIKTAISNNLQVKTALLEVQHSKALQETAYDLPKTNLTLSQDPTSGGNMDNAIGISQSFALPGVYINQKKALEQQTRLTEESMLITQAEIAYNVREAYYSLLYAKDKMKVFDYLDDIYSNFNRKAELRLKTGETSNLEKLAAQGKYQELQLSKKEAEADINIQQYRLRQLLNSRTPVSIAADTLQPIRLPQVFDTSFNRNPTVQYYNQSRNVSAARIRVERSRRLPELTLGYNHQMVVKNFNPAKVNRDYFDGTRIAGLQLGVSVPLFAGSYNSRIRAEKVSQSIAESKLAETQRNLQSEWDQGYQNYLKFKQSLEYYQTSGLYLANEQIRVAQFAFSKGEIGYVEFIQNISAATDSKLNYLSTVYSLNDAIIGLQYLQGEEYLP